MNRLFYFCLLSAAVALLMTGFPHPVHAASACPFTVGGETVVWTIDNVDADGTATACQEKQANDCNLFGVINYINDILPLDPSLGGCAGDQLAGSTLKLQFSNAVSSATLSSALILKPSLNLGKLVIDGFLGKDPQGKDLLFKFQGTGTSFLLVSIECPLATTADCGAVSDAVDIEISRLEFQSGNSGLTIDEKNAQRSDVTLSQLSFKGQPTSGLSLLRLLNTRLSLSDIQTEGLQNSVGLFFLYSSIDDARFSRLAIRGPSPSSPAKFGLRFASVSGQNLLFDDLKIENVGTGLRFDAPLNFTKGVKNIDLKNSAIHFITAGVSFQNVAGDVAPNGDTLAISNSSILGGYDGSAPCVTDSAAIRLKNSKSFAENSLANVVIEQNPALGGACRGVLAEGNVSGVLIRTTTFRDIGQNAIEAGFIPNVSAEPQRISHDDNTYENVGGNPVVYLTNNPAGSWIFQNGLIDQKATNGGAETPPLPMKKIRLVRESARPDRVTIELDYFDGTESLDLLWKNGSSYLPVTIESPVVKDPAACGAVGGGPTICKYSAVAAIGPGNPLNYPEGEDLATSNLLVAMRAGSATSMFSDPAPVAQADWSDQEVIQIDTAIDDPMGVHQGCLANVLDDCSLRGAMAYAKARRDAGKTHEIVARFREGLGDISVGFPVQIAANDLRIEGPATIRPSAALTSLMEIYGDHVDLQKLTLDGDKKAPAIVEASEQLFLTFDQVTFKNIGAGQFAVQAPKSGPVPYTGIRLLSPVFQNVDPAGFGAGVSGGAKNPKFAYVEGMTLIDSGLPENMISDMGSGPAVTEAIQFNLPEMTAEVYGNFPKTADGIVSCRTLDAYVHFTGRPGLLLEPAGLYTPAADADGNFHVTVQFPDWPQTEMVTWEEMDLYLACHEAKANDVDVTWNLSPKTVVVPSLWSLVSEGDGRFDLNDNCPLAANADQKNDDGDPLGDVCDSDRDGDGVDNDFDNCTDLANVRQADSDSDGLGDACDSDDDNDGVTDSSDNCPFDFNPDPLTMIATEEVCVPDNDKDGVRDDQDNCEEDANADQTDTDGDGAGDACDQDNDNDTVVNGSDNCPFSANLDQKDSDGDGKGDFCDDDLDGDGRLNEGDSCPTLANTDQADTDEDGEGDLCDTDRDGDTKLNDTDNCPDSANPEQTDTDGDGQGDACDDDQDGDNIPNASDNCPFQPNPDQGACVPAPVAPTPPPPPPPPPPLPSPSPSPPAPAAGGCSLVPLSNTRR